MPYDSPFLRERDQRRPYIQRPPNKRGAEPPHLFPVNFDVAVPMSHWKAGAEVIPPKVGARVQRLKQYEDWYNGDFRDLTNYYRTTPNWMKAIAQTRGRILAADLPDIEGNISDRKRRDVEDELIDILFTTGVDKTRYGLGLRVVRKNYSVAVPPTVWFPANRYESVLCYVDKSDIDNQTATVWKFTPEVVIEEFWTVEADKLSDRITYIEDTSLQSRLFVFPAFPRISPLGFGDSQYEALKDLQGELSRRLSRTSSILDTQAIAKRVYMPEANNPQSGGLDVAAVGRSGSADEAFVNRSADAEDIILPPGYKDVQYRFVDTQGQWELAHVKRIEDALFDAGGMPRSLIGGYVVGDAPAKKLYINLFYNIKETWRQIEHTGSDLLSVYADTKITLSYGDKEPFEAVDKQVIENLGTTSGGETTTNEERE